MESRGLQEHTMTHGCQKRQSKPVKTNSNLEKQANYKITFTSKGIFLRRVNQSAKRNFKNHTNTQIQMGACNELKWVLHQKWHLTFCFHVLSFGSLPNVNGEHNYFWSHGGHPITKAELVGPIHVGCKRVLPTGLSVSFIDSFIIWSCDLEAGEKKKQKIH